MKYRFSIFGLMLFLLLPVANVRAQDGIAGAWLQQVKPPTPIFNLRSHLAAADFDNDQKPDGAILQEAGLLEGKRAFRIELHLSGGCNNAITFSTLETALSISALDVDRDDAPDIVIEKAFTHQRIQIYINDGHGGFRQARADDYPSSDRPGPIWRASFDLGMPTLCLPTTRSFEIGDIQRAKLLNRTSRDRSSFWSEILLNDSGARAPSAIRAPPSSLFL